MVSHYLKRMMKEELIYEKRSRFNGNMSFYPLGEKSKFNGNIHLLFCSRY